MRNIKCADCDEYRNEWCEKVIDSPYPDDLRDCQYWHERKDMVEVIRCRDCKHWDELLNLCKRSKHMALGVNGFCSKAEGKDE